MLDGRVLEASQVEYKPFGKPPLQKKVHRTGFFLCEKKKEPNFAMKLALGLDVQTRGESSCP